MTQNVKNKMSVTSYLPGDILRETIKEIYKIFGNSLDKIRIEKIIIGLFFTGVKLDNGAGGLCFTPIKTISEDACYPSAEHIMPPSGRMKDLKASKIIEEMWSGNFLKKAFGIAVLNALSSMCWEKKKPADYNITTQINVLNDIKMTNNGFAVVIGDLLPAFKILKKRNIPYRIIELYHTIIQNDDLQLYIHPKYARRIVPEADLLIITGKTLINDTLEYYLNIKKPDARTIVIGPTVSMLPEAFFKRGVNTIGGTIVTDPDKVLDVVAEAGSGYHFFEKGVERVVINNIQYARKKTIRNCYVLKNV
jgi:uncharacterized protein